MTYNHREAFCLMKYATDDGSEIEWLWNSRDGVTPFTIQSKSGKLMRHVQWQFDVRILKYEPMSCERVFVDATEALARPKAEEMIRRQQPNLGGQELQDVINNTVQHWIGRPGTPWILTGAEYNETPVNSPANRPHVTESDTFRDAINRARMAYCKKAKIPFGET